MSQLKHQSADTKLHAADTRHKSADMKRHAADSNHKSADTKPHAADTKLNAADRRHDYEDDVTAALDAATSAPAVTSRTSVTAELPGPMSYATALRRTNREPIAQEELVTNVNETKSPDLHGNEPELNKDLITMTNALKNALKINNSRSDFKDNASYLCEQKLNESNYDILCGTNSDLGDIEADISSMDNLNIEDPNLQHPVSYYHGPSLIYRSIQSMSCQMYEILKHRNENSIGTSEASSLVTQVPTLQNALSDTSSEVETPEMTISEASTSLSFCSEAKKKLEKMRKDHFNSLKIINKLEQSNVNTINVVSDIANVKCEEILYIQIKQYLPKFWCCSQSYIEFRKADRFLLQALESTNSSYKWIESIINESVGDWFKIENIQRVENPYLWLMYKLKKQELESTEDIQEYNLFHGTKAINIESICLDNFNWRTQGVRFSKLASHASQYCDQCSDGGNKMILARVLLMNGCEAIQDTNSSSPEIDLMERVFKYVDNAFYPEYLITFSTSKH